ncbi:lytic transglycosylase domain-containing protein [Azospirillum sp. sgz302134]
MASRAAARSLTRKALLTTAAATILAWSCSAAAFQERKTPASRLAGTAWEQVARQHGLDPALLYAIALVESRRYYPGEEAFRPHPWALRGPEGPKYPADAEAARRVLRSMDPSSLRATDIGLMQVNYHWHGHRVERPEDLLDPYTNITVAATILAEAVATAPNDLELGIGHYHCYDSQRARAYGREVIAIWRRLRTAEPLGRQPR